MKPIRHVVNDTKTIVYIKTPDAARFKKTRTIYANGVEAKMQFFFSDIVTYVNWRPFTFNLEIKIIEVLSKYTVTNIKKITDKSTSKNTYSIQLQSKNFSN